MITCFPFKVKWNQSLLLCEWHNSIFSLISTLWTTTSMPRSSVVCFCEALLCSWAKAAAAGKLVINTRTFFYPLTNNLTKKFKKIPDHFLQKQYNFRSLPKGRAIHLDHCLASLVVGQLQVGVLILQLIFQLRDARLQTPLLIHQSLSEITRTLQMSNHPANASWAQRKRKKNPEHYSLTQI